MKSYPFLLLFSLSCILSTCIACVSAVQVKQTMKKPGAVSFAISRTYQVMVECTPGVATDTKGSAVDVGGGKVLTAKHITKGRETCHYTLKTESGEEHTAWFVKDNPDQDVALLMTGTDLPQVPMASTELGMHVYCIGYPRQVATRQTELTVTDGVVATNVWVDGEVRITAPVYFGNSGGGVWNDWGELVGISISLMAFTNGFAQPVPYEGNGYIVPTSGFVDLIN